MVSGCLGVRRLMDEFDVSSEPGSGTIGEGHEMAMTETSLRVGELLIETAAITKDGEEVSGDRACVGHTDAGVLVGVVDGLGHGADAGEAAQRAGAVLEDPATGMGVTEALQRCHVALRGTRGAVIALAAFPTDATDMEWLAVGNIEGILVRGRSGRTGREMIVQRPGSVGHHTPPRARRRSR